MKLMGVDVGFSKASETTGIACLDGSKLHLGRAGTSWTSRKTQLPLGFHPGLIAFDGPLLPSDANELVRRRCESLFIRAPFHNRCKPGLSDWGIGLKLRRATAEARVQFSSILAVAGSNGSNALVSRGGCVVEAFPNAFLALLLPEQEIIVMPKLRRGQRFDWLYERVVTSGRLKSLLSDCLDLHEEFWDRIEAETDHELRAALICLLTAVFASRKTAAIVGHSECGWFWLPPRELWQPWAKKGFHAAAAVMAAKGKPLDELRDP
jgi:hypothetical protein